MQKLKKNGTRFLCLSMAVVMVFGSITGCGKKANKNNVTDFEIVSETVEGITETTTEKETESTPEETTTEKESESVTEKPSEVVTEKPSEKPTEKETESTPEETTTKKENESVTEKPSEAVTEKPSEKPTEKETESTPEETTTKKENESVTEKPSEPVTEKPSEKPTEKPTEKETESTPEETTTEKETEIKKYTVTLYYGDKEFGKVTEEEGTLLSEIMAPFIEGKMFLGWYYDSKLAYAVGVKDTLGKDTTLYAKYENIKYTVTLYNGSETIDVLTEKYGTLLSEINAPEIEGKKFEGWYYDEALTNKVKTGDKLTGNVTLYARYTVKEYMVSLYNGESKLNEVTVKHGTAISEIAVPSIDEMVFQGWYYDSALTKKAAQEDIITGSTVLYGSYIEVERSYTITLYNGSSKISDLVKGEGTLLNSISAPEETGKKFEGWYYDSALTQKVGAEDKLSKDTELYAKYIEIWCKVILNNGDRKLYDKTVKYGTRISNLDIPDIEGKQFNGWYYNAELTEEVKADDILTTDITLYAKYSVLTYTITLYNVSEQPEILTKEYGTLIISAITAPSIEGRVFAGWYYDDELTKKVSEEDTLKANITLYAYYAKTEYTITIGNAADDAKITKFTKKRGVKLSSINGPYIDGKIFLGWYYDSALTDKVAVDDILDKDMTLYADYGNAMPISEGGSPNYISAVEQDEDFTIYVTTDTVERKNVSTDDVKAALKLTNITSPERTDDSNTLEKDELVVVKTAAGRYSVNVNGGFRAGDTYRLEIIDNDIALSFEGQTKDVVYYNFTIKKDEILNLSLNTGIKYLAASELEKQYADNIMAYTGLYTAEKDAQTGETVYKPTNTTGAFTYKAGEYIAGDVIAVYTGTKPDERTLDTSLDEAVSYIEITMVESDGDTAVYSYKSANATDVLFTPDIIPIDIDNGDGVTGWTEAAT